MKRMRSSFGHVWRTNFSTSAAAQKKKSAKEKKLTRIPQYFCEREKEKGRKREEAVGSALSPGSLSKHIAKHNPKAEKR